MDKVVTESRRTELKKEDRRRLDMAVWAARHGGVTLRSTMLRVFALFFGLYVLTAGGHLYSPDEEIMFRLTESIALRGELSIDPIREGDGSTFASRAGRSGREYAQYGLGNSLAAVPLYWLAVIACTLTPSDAAEDALDFHTTLYAPPGRHRGHALLKRLVVSFQGAIVAALLCALLWRFAFLQFLRGGYDFPDARRAAWISALAFGAGSMAWPHARTFFSEPLAALFVLASLHTITAGARLTPRRAAGAGLLFALALAVRLDSLFVLPGIGVACAARLCFERDAATPIRRMLHMPVWLGFAVPFFGFAAYQATLNWVMFGSITASGYADQKEGIRFTTPVLAGLYGYLFSIGKSVLLFSPVIVLMFAGVAPALRKMRPLALGAIAVIVFGLIVHSKWQNWSGGWDWGPRHVYIILPFTCLFVGAFALEWTQVKRSLFTALLTVSIAVQLYGCSQNPVDFYLLYFRTPFTPPNAMALYSPADTAPQIVRLEIQSPQGPYRPLPWGMLAPINDSVYVPQNSQWYRYAEMWRLGYRDNLWLRLLRRAQRLEQPVD